MSGVSKHLIDHYLHELLSRINFGTFNEIEGLRDFFVKTSMYVFNFEVAKNGSNFFGKMQLHFEIKNALIPTKNEISQFLF